jgi:hypothetical protein
VRFSSGLRELRAVDLKRLYGVTVSAKKLNKANIHRSRENHSEKITPAGFRSERSVVSKNGLNMVNLKSRWVLAIPAGFACAPEELDYSRLPLGPLLGLPASLEVALLYYVTVCHPEMVDTPRIERGSSRGILSIDSHACWGVRFGHLPPAGN